MKREILALKELSQTDWDQINTYGARERANGYDQDPAKCIIQGFLVWLVEQDAFMRDPTEIDPCEDSLLH